MFKSWHVQGVDTRGLGNAEVSKLEHQFLYHLHLQVVQEHVSIYHYLTCDRNRLMKSVIAKQRWQKVEIYNLTPR